jgi:hypothetical protein
MKNFWKLGLALVGSLASAGAFSQQTVQWDADSAVLAGNGCQKDVDAFVIENGNDLAIVFSSLGVDLPGNQSRTLAGRKTCLARVKATVAQGRYIAKLTQRLSFGVTKTARTRGSIAVNSTFFGFRVPIHTVDVPYGQSINNPLMQRDRQDYFSVNTTRSWYDSWCRARSPQGLYSAQLAVSGQKDNAAEDLIMFADGLDLRFELVAGLQTCL